MTFTGLEIKTIRKKMKLSQTEFGKMLGVGLRAVQNWEGGERKISDTAALLLQKIIKYEYTSQTEAIEDIIVVTDPPEPGERRKAKFEKIMDKLSIDQIITYIHEHEKNRGFDENPTYRMFLEIRMQREIIARYEKKAARQEKKK